MVFGIRQVTLKVSDFGDQKERPFTLTYLTEVKVKRLGNTKR